MNQIKYGQMIISIELVNPTIAKRWLEQNTNNRRLRRESVNKYARDMSAGDWHRKPVAICFDDSGLLGNGQHTLNAIIESGTSQELLIARNVPRKSIALMDIGLKRTFADVAHFIGENYDSRRGAVARTAAWGVNWEQKSFDEVFDAYREHKEVIDFVCDRSPKKVGYSAAVLAVCARAMYTHDASKVERFLDILTTGLVDDLSESAAVRLRDFLRTRGIHGRAGQNEVFRKTTSALAAFLRGEPLAKIYGTGEDLFPLPQQLERKVA